MKLWVTEIRAIDPLTGELKTYGGPNVPGINQADAERYCRENLGMCKVLGELVAEIPCKPGGYEPDWDNIIDYEKQSEN